MKFLIFFFLCFFLAAAFAQEHKIDSPAAALKRHDFFALRDMCLKADLPAAKLAYYRAYILNAFNDCERSARVISKLTNERFKKLDQKSRIALLMLQIDNYVKTFQYRKAAVVCEELLIRFGKNIDSSKVADLNNTDKLWTALKTVARQQVSISRPVSLNWTRDAAGLMNIPVTVGNQTQDFVFDTGANISTINESYAVKLHLQLIRSIFQVGSSTSVSNPATLAVAPEIKLGTVVLKNVVFIVLPDEQLRFRQINYEIHGIIGYPVISQLGEIRINKAGTMLLMANQVRRSLQNLSMNELTPVIRLEVNHSMLPFVFDTGAKQTEFTSHYFEKFKGNILASGKPDSIKWAGAGGAKSYQIYKIPQAEFTISGKKTTLNDITVAVNPNGSTQDYYFGSIGQDLIGKFGEMIINFKKMYIDFVADIDR